ncbi:MAG: hypothetical protein NVS3B19_19180 [Ginsengibacter sp.]
MSKANTIGAIILGAAAGVALLKFFNMPEDERQEFISHLKNRAHHLLDDAEGTVEKVKHHLEQIDLRDHPVDNLFGVKNMLTDLFGSERRFLI